MPGGAHFSAVTSDGSGGFWAYLQAYVTKGKLVHYSRGRWAVIALPWIKGSTNIPQQAPTIASLAAAPGASQVWAAISYFRSRGGQLADLIYRYPH